jgi:hypothetical protein
MGKLIDLTGVRFGFWIVKERGPNNENGQIQWMCLCECGKKRLVVSGSLRSGNSTSCGCNHTPDLTGNVFGDLIILKLYDQDLHKKSRRYWLCRCVCGNILTVSTTQLREKDIVCCEKCIIIHSPLNSKDQVLLIANLRKNLTILTKAVLNINNVMSECNEFFDILNEPKELPK